MTAVPAGVPAFVPPADPAARIAEAERWGQAILPEVSRTFAISIRFLPGDLGRAVLTAYLLCRIADTVEDDNSTPPDVRAQLLDEFLKTLTDRDAAEAFPAKAARLKGDEAHLRLVANTDLVLVLFRTLPPRTQERVAHWVREMGLGMAKFVRTYPQGIRIQTLAEYKEYCYYVAGTVGCMLTELWHLHAKPVGKREFEKLWVKCQAFGEALQTVNILKDIAWDAQHENSIYIPAQDLAAEGSSHETLLSPQHLEHNHKAVRHFIELARTDLDDALEYILLIPRRAVAIRAFCVLPLLFAYATLRDLSGSRAMLTVGGSVKISRREVKALMVVGLLALLSNAMLRRLVRRVKARPFTLVAVGG
ncbi:MAG: phytoene/squalene synthase family protein [Gemmatimonadaceae bacterium]|nr:phytoene/squalene synthase family protein [Gemmatimonadaceae bacterium]